MPPILVHSPPAGRGDMQIPPPPLKSFHMPAPILPHTAGHGRAAFAASVVVSYEASNHRKL
jgi:hypothetical protein